MVVRLSAYPSLIGRTAIITGGGRGLGQVMALALAGAGANVVITASRSQADLDETKALIEESSSGACLAILADVGVWEACEAVVAQTLAHFGRIDILVNNAARGSYELAESGSHGPPGSPAPKMLDASVDGLRAMFDVNLIGPLLMTKAALPALQANGVGRIVNISTSRPTMLRPYMGPYGPIKAALEAMTAIWAKELEATGVTANVLLPGGATDTAIIPGAVGTRADPDFRQGKGPKGLEGARAFMPPEIMAAPILWLASDASESVTGRRFIARDWDPDLPPAEAAAGAMQPATPFPTIM
jgi:NAD(P)-dependent dehydrogenase (short-subunit alcohol dehydrogenase family)